jgi:hypothetical protein
VARRLTTRMAELWWAGRLGLWFCSLPVRLHGASLPTFLARLPQVRPASASNSRVGLARAVRIALRVGRLRWFRAPLFPRACLRQALALTYILRRLGYPVVLHFGVRKAGATLEGHSWVTLDGHPVAEDAELDVFTPVYASPAAAPGATPEAGILQYKGGPYGAKS